MKDAGPRTNSSKSNRKWKKNLKNEALIEAKSTCLKLHLLPRNKTRNEVKRQRLKIKPRKKAPLLVGICTTPTVCTELMINAWQRFRSWLFRAVWVMCSTLNWKNKPESRWWRKKWRKGLKRGMPLAGDAHSTMTKMCLLLTIGIVNSTRSWKETIQSTYQELNLTLSVGVPSDLLT